MTSDELLAAEFVLGLLEGEDLLAARARAQSDAAFAEKITYWQDRLAPLADTIAPRTPRAELWPRIEAALASESEAAGSESAKIVSLRRNLRRWQWAGGFSAAAAVVLAFLALPQLISPGLDTDERLPTAVQQARLAATMPIEGTPLSLALTYLPEDDSLLVGAVGLAADGVHDHEIWFVPDSGGDLVSLGVVTPGRVVAHNVPERVARALHEGSQLVLTREPLGGKPPDTAAGPVVAEARFTTI